jgi:two-component sensor histidine kinase
MDRMVSMLNNDFSRQRSLVSFEDETNDLKLLLHEAIHRMKNTLMLLAASVRRDFARGATGEMSEAVERFEARIAAFGKLYRLLSSDDPHPMSIEPFFGALCQALSDAILKPSGIRCDATIDAGLLPAEQCHRLAMMVTEVVTNSAKYAFADRRGAQVNITIVRRDGRWSCRVADNGVGVRQCSKGTGGRLLESLARGIGGEYRVETGPAGTAVTIVMPEIEYEAVARDQLGLLGNGSTIATQREVILAASASATPKIF